MSDTISNTMIELLNLSRKSFVGYNYFLSMASVIDEANHDLELWQAMMRPCVGCGVLVHFPEDWPGDQRLVFTEVTECSVDGKKVKVKDTSLHFEQEEWDGDGFTYVCKLGFWFCTV